MGTFIEPADSARLLTARGDASDGRLCASHIDASVQVGLGDISDFGAVVMALTGHDLRQPLQIIIAAHDMSTRHIDGEAERAQLTLTEFVSLVGQTMGGEITRDYRLALGTSSLTRPQLAQVLVDIKRQINGDFYIIEEENHRR